MSSYMPGPFCHISFTITAWILTFFTTSRMGWSRKDSNGLSVYWNEAANVVSMDSAVWIGCTSTEYACPIFHTVATKVISVSMVMIAGTYYIIDWSNLIFMRMIHILEIYRMMSYIYAEKMFTYVVVSSGIAGWRRRRKYSCRNST